MIEGYGRYGVGPVASPDDHETVTAISTSYDTDNATDDETVFVCLDCGLVAGDKRRFQVSGCDRDKNPIPQTWRERGFPE